jgi:hypothetical protein
MFRLSILLTIAFILGACAPRAATPDFDALSTDVAATLQHIAETSAAAATAVPSETATQVVLPTFTSSPAPSATPDGNRISFATGATQGVVTGQVLAGQRVTYVAGAAQNQIMIATLSTPAGNAVMEIVGADGSVLLTSSTGYTSFRTLLPKTQDYEFRVVGGNSTQDFTLSVIFAVPVRFASGADSVTYEGATAGGLPVTYAVYAQNNQDMHVTVDTDPDDAALTIWGFNDGNPYARAQNGVVNFSLDLPETQYYIIEVVPQGGRVIEYELEIEIN